MNAEDAADLTALLKRHNEFEEKVGAGIASFEVSAAPDGHEGKCFWAVRRDGSKIDFSFKHCLQAKPFDRSADEIWDAGKGTFNRQYSL